MFFRVWKVLFVETWAGVICTCTIKVHVNVVCATSILFPLCFYILLLYFLSLPSMVYGLLLAIDWLLCVALVLNPQSLQLKFFCDWRPQSFFNPILCLFVFMCSTPLKFIIYIYSFIVPENHGWKTSLSFWEDLFSGAMLVYRRVGISYPSAPATPFDLLAFALNCEDLQWACDLNKDFVFAGDLTLGSSSVPQKIDRRPG